MGNYLCGLMVLLGGAVMDGDDFYRFLVSGLFSLITDIPPEEDSLGWKNCGL